MISTNNRNIFLNTSHQKQAGSFNQLQIVVTLVADKMKKQWFMYCVSLSSQLICHPPEN